MVHPALNDPKLLQLFPTLCYLTTIGLLIYTVIDYRRNKAFSIPALGFIGGTSLWWLEWYGDWASYLQYNPHQALLPWGQTLWTTPFKPWWMIPAYGAFYAVAIPGGLAIGLWILGRFPRLPRIATIAVVASVFLYLFDISIEIPAITYGWWTYTQTFGPTFESARGGTLPLTHPLGLNMVFVALTAVIFDRRNDKGLVWFERVANIGRLAPGGRREAVRVVVWCVAINIMYFVFFMGPLMVIRGLFGHPDAYVP